MTSSAMWVFSVCAVDRLERTNAAVPVGTLFAGVPRVACCCTFCCRCVFLAASLGTCAWGLPQCFSFCRSSASPSTPLLPPPLWCAARAFPFFGLRTLFQLDRKESRFVVRGETCYVSFGGRGMLAVRSFSVRATFMLLLRRVRAPVPSACSLRTLPPLFSLSALLPCELCWVLLLLVQKRRSGGFYPAHAQTPSKYLPGSCFGLVMAWHWALLALGWTGSLDGIMAGWAGCCVISSLLLRHLRPSRAFPPAPLCLPARCISASRRSLSLRRCSVFAAVLRLDYPSWRTGPGTTGKRSAVSHVVALELFLHRVADPLLCHPLLLPSAAGVTDAWLFFLSRAEPLVPLPPPFFCGLPLLGPSVSHRAHTLFAALCCLLCALSPCFSLYFPPPIPVDARQTRTCVLVVCSYRCTTLHHEARVFFLLLCWLQAVLLLKYRWISRGGL
jgi:hypothetical protein